jgi:hypothetical protein
MRPKPHAVVSEMRRDLVRLDKLTSTRYISLSVSPTDGLRRTGCVVKKPAGTVTLSSAEGEALIAQVRQSNLPPADAGTVEQIIRMYFWVVFALQEAKRSVKRRRRLLFGKGPKPEQPPAPEASSTLGDAVGKDEGGGEWAPIDQETPGFEVAGGAEGAERGAAEASPTAPGGHRAGTGRLGADAYVGAERPACRHEELAVGQRCPVCGQGTLSELPPGVERRIDGHAVLSAMRDELHKLRCSACGQMFTASLPRDAGEEKDSARARAV